MGAPVRTAHLPREAGGQATLVEARPRHVGRDCRANGGLAHLLRVAGDGREQLIERGFADVAAKGVEFEIKEGPKGLQAVNVVRTQAEIAAVAN